MEALLERGEPRRRRRLPDGLDARPIHRFNDIAQHVFGQRDDHWPRPPAHCHRKGARDIFGDTRRIINPRRPFGKRGEHRGKIDFLKPFTVTHPAINVADEQDHRLAILHGDMDADAGVGRAWPACDERDAGALRQCAVGTGHEAHPALLPADDSLHRRRIMKRIEHGKEAFARDSENPVAPLDHKLIDKDASAGAEVLRLVSHHLGLANHGGSGNGWIDIHGAKLDVWLPNLVMFIWNVYALGPGAINPMSVSMKFARLFARVIVGISLLWAAPGIAAVCAPATSQGTAPPSWQTYCWLDMTGYVEATARSAAGQFFTYTLSDGATLAFTLKLTGTPTLVSRAAPSWTGAAVGNTAFLGIPNKPILYTQLGGTNVLTVSNITLTPPAGSPAASAYMFVAADAESTNSGESLRFVTNGGNWTVLDQVDPISGSTYPTISGAGTQTFTETGAAGTVGGYIVGSISPTTVTSTIVGGGLQGVMFAVRFASIRLTKTITGARVAAADQFTYRITSTGNGSVFGSNSTSGTANSGFVPATVSLASGIPVTVSEIMTAGSSSALSKYVSRLTCVNGTAGSTTPLPNNVTTTSFNFGSLLFGDAIDCTFNNAAIPHINLQKALGSARVFAADQFQMNIANGATIVATTTTTGTGSTVTTGATGLTQVVAATAYAINEAAAGSTVLNYYNSTLSCTNAATSSATILPTAAPGTITPILGDVITCTITNTARPATGTLSAAKSATLISDPVNGTANPKMIPGAVINYAITVSNTGTLPIDSSSIFVLDPLPADITYNNGVAVTFSNGTPASGLTFSTATDVKFSNGPASPAAFANCTYAPTAGYDVNVKFVCIRPSGVMSGATAAGQPSFTIGFQARIN